MMPACASLAARENFLADYAKTRRNLFAGEDRFSELRDVQVPRLKPLALPARPPQLDEQATTTPAKPPSGIRTSAVKLPSTPEEAQSAETLKGSVGTVRETFKDQ